MSLLLVVVSAASGAAGAWAYRTYAQAEIAKIEAGAAKEIAKIKASARELVLAARYAEAQVGAKAEHVLKAVEVEVKKIL
jgi:hypothetical protein